jgi:hypothetical protein
MDLVDMAQDWDQWRAPAIPIMVFWFREVLGNLSVAEKLLASQDGLSSMEVFYQRVFFVIRTRSPQYCGGKPLHILQ